MADIKIQEEGTGDVDKVTIDQSPQMHMVTVPTVFNPRRSTPIVSPLTFVNIKNIDNSNVIKNNYDDSGSQNNDNQLKEQPNNNIQEIATQHIPMKPCNILNDDSDVLVGEEEDVESLGVSPLQKIDQPTNAKPKNYSRFISLATEGMNWNFFPAFGSEKMTNAPDILFFDLETTGRNPGNSRIVQFGSLLVGADMSPKSKYSILINAPGMTRGAARINNIVPKMLKGKPEFKDVAADIYNVMNNKIWAGHNVIMFDIPKLYSEYEIIGCKPPTCLGVIDTLIVFAAWKLNLVVPDLTLNTIGRFYGFGTEAHEAYDDAERSYNCLMKAMAARGMSTLVSPAMLPSKTISMLPLCQSRNTTETPTKPPIFTKPEQPQRVPSPLRTSSPPVIITNGNNLNNSANAVTTTTTAGTLDSAILFFIH
jgi:DNA polymerase III epsilon subunit-like protein